MFIQGVISWACVCTHVIMYIVNFFSSHNLSLHPEKTKFMFISHSKVETMPKIFINYNSLNGPQDPNKIFNMKCVNDSPDPYIKFLGILIDPQLSFKFHIKSVTKKLSTSLYFLRNSRHILNERARKSIYYATFHSHLIYGIQLWTCCSDSLLKPIIQKQKMAIRIIAGAKYNSHTEPLFKRLNILPFNMLSQYFKIQFMQQFTQKFLPIALENSWITNNIRRENQAHVVLRNDDILNIPFARTSTTSRLPLTSFPKLWTEFPDKQIKFIRNKPEFNFKLKKYFIDMLNPLVRCGRLICQDCHLNI